ncbi:DNA repair protein RecO [Marinobacter sp. X15-166B]|uniref:DNA repair protein RecO n=1 Tax=Marinobacter sp. X15-166B TaxID=1897620 RepID=UPI00085CCEFE|nr:DNA repair protein RecO [Marinobacter sp. X15-166B]OEY66909.1 DNA repair protein RecO [Marinobacter sp. X15-166B]
MSTAVQQEPAYVLHRRPYRETGLLVDVFSLNYGRLSLVARNGNSQKSPLKAQLQPFQPLLLDWRGRGDLKNLTHAEIRQGPGLTRTLSLYSGLYLNELLQRVLPAGDPHQELFAAYIEALTALSEALDVEPVLRQFEMAFAIALGYGFDWGRATDTGRPVAAGLSYGYHPEQGILQLPQAQTPLTDLPGKALQALAAGEPVSLDSRRVAKRVMRVLVDYLLQGRPLNSRTLFRQR